jgi:D-threo-aldose 1-dehydrogenase
MIERARRIAEICRGDGVSRPHAAVQYPLRHSTVGLAVLGTELHLMRQQRTPLPHSYS